MYATTLHDFLKALPGELKITAKFPEATVEISQFEDVKKATEGCVERTLLSAAFDFDSWQPVATGSFVKGGIPRPPTHKLSSRTK